MLTSRSQFSAGCRLFGNYARAFCLSVFFYRGSDVEYRYRISNCMIELRMSSCFCVDGDIFYNASRVDADLLCTDKKDAFSQIS